MSVFFLLQKFNIFLAKTVPYWKQWCESCVRNFLALFIFFYKATINDKVSFTNYVPGIRLPDCSKLTINQKMTMTSQFANITSLSIFFYVVLFLLSSLVTGPSFILTSLLLLELWQFSFIRNWPEIRKYPRLSFAQCLETRAS